jgi:hypothetical protein
MTSDVNTTVENAVVPKWTLGRNVQLPNCMLVVESGPDAGKKFGPLRELTTIGRKDYCDVDLTDTSVSKEHCELSWTMEGLRLRDLGSTNGIKCLDTRVWDLILPPNASSWRPELRIRFALAGDRAGDPKGLPCRAERLTGRWEVGRGFCPHGSR